MQEAYQYLSQEVPTESQTPGMYTSLLEAALRAADMRVARRALQLMEDVGVAPDSRTAAAALRIMVGCPAAQPASISSSWAPVTREQRLPACNRAKC